MKFLEGAAETEVEVKAFRDGFFPYVGLRHQAVFRRIEAAVLSRPDLHPLSRRSASGSPADLGSDMEHVSVTT